MIGQIVNYRYEVLEKIGDGELFSVYKARDKVLNRLVALKVLSKDLAANREFAAAVEGGYRAAAGLLHPSIARVLDADSSFGDCVIACEFARGISVKDRVHRAGPVAVPLALDIIIPVLEALEYAHANRIVHGDIRPHDIIVSPDGEVKVTDFGLSQAFASFPAVADSFQMRSIHYQAPEVVEGNPATVASDLYSVGVVLYQMLTNSLPFEGGSAVSIALKKVKDTPVPPKQINAGVPRSLSDIIMRVLEAAPGDRYPTASAMLADLRALRDGLRVGQPGAPASISVPKAAREAAGPSPSPEQDSLARGYWWWLALFVLAVIVSLSVTMLVIGKRSELIVPPLLGRTWEEATRIADEKGIKLEDGPAFSETYPSGQICAVMPPAGSTVPQSNPIVRVKISSGPSTVAVPDVVGMSEADANEAAVKAGFTIGKVKEQYSEKVPINSVVSQDPPGNLRRTPGSAIDLIISQGPKPPPDTSSEPGVGESGGERRFTVAVEVPADADGPQNVLIKVYDDRGETTAYEQVHEPSEKFTTPISAEGSNIRIKVYVGKSLVKDVTYR